MDMLLSTGEQVTIALLSMALNEQKLPAVSFTGWQAGIVTEPIHGNARITTINTEAVKKSTCRWQSGDCRRIPRGYRNW
jgi:aspartate kinase